MLFSENVFSVSSECCSDFVGVPDYGGFFNRKL